jgi:hypothetical protein
METEIEKLTTKLKQLECEYESVTMCFNCGKRAWEIDADEDADLGVIRFDRGSPGDRYEPEEPAQAYFVCRYCIAKEP